MNKVLLGLGFISIMLNLVQGQASCDEVCCSCQDSYGQCAYINEPLGGFDILCQCLDIRFDIHKYCHTIYCSDRGACKVEY